MISLHDAGIQSLYLVTLVAIIRNALASVRYAWNLVFPYMQHFLIIVNTDERPWKFLNKRNSTRVKYQQINFTAIAYSMNFHRGDNIFCPAMLNAKRVSSRSERRIDFIYISLYPKAALICIHSVYKNKPLYTLTTML